MYNRLNFSKLWLCLSDFLCFISVLFPYLLCFLFGLFNQFMSFHQSSIKLYKKSHVVDLPAIIPSVNCSAFVFPLFFEIPSTSSIKQIMVQQWCLLYLPEKNLFFCGFLIRFTWRCWDVNMEYAVLWNIRIPFQSHHILIVRLQWKIKNLQRFFQIRLFLKTTCKLLIYWKLCSNVPTIICIFMCLPHPSQYLFRLIVWLTQLITHEFLGK